MGSLHPAIVHLPIGILILYTLFEYLRKGRFFQSTNWQMTKAMTLFVGYIGGLFAYVTGDILSGTREETLLVERHELFSILTLIVYGVLTIGYIIWYFDHIQWVRRFKHPFIKASWRIKIRVSQCILKPAVTVGLATLGLLFMTITGGLGGAITHGPDADPLVALIVHLFGQ